MVDKVVGLDGKPLDNVVHLDNETMNDIPVEKILDEAKKEGVSVAMIIGWRDNGKFYFASSTGDCADMNLIIDSAKLALMDYMRG